MTSRSDRISNQDAGRDGTPAPAMSQQSRELSRELFVNRGNYSDFTLVSLTVDRTTVDRSAGVDVNDLSTVNCWPWTTLHRSAKRHRLRERQREPATLRAVFDSVWYV